MEAAALQVAGGLDSEELYFRLDGQDCTSSVGRVSRYQPAAVQLFQTSVGGDHGERWSCFGRGGPETVDLWLERIGSPAVEGCGESIARGEAGAVERKFPFQSGRVGGGGSGF